jgi:hypothetical protein
MWEKSWETVGEIWEIHGKKIWNPPSTWRLTAGKIIDERGRIVHFYV